ncbi:MAG: hypothetical protein JWO46_792 [Nocardioidaceae bacterium]|nr:hypothetical protein [Nocardioidaceae bacterium]
MTDEPGIQLGLAEAALAAVLLVGGLLRLEHQITLVVVLLTLLYAGSRLGSLWAAGLGLSAWAMFTGFAENTLGTLTFAQGDVLRLGLMVAGCAAVAHVVRRERTVSR